METGLLSPMGCETSGVVLEGGEACTASSLPSLARRLAEPALVASLLLALTLALAWHGGAMTGEFGDVPDEAGHFITGLMVRDFVVSGHWFDPMGFARTYYDCYPKVALGHWPPLFYVVQAAFMGIAGASRASAMLMMCSITAAAALLLYARLREPAGRLASLGMAVALVALPLVRRMTGMVMPEMLVALFSFAALLAFERYLRRGQWKWSALFGILAALAVLTKGNGWALVLVPPLCVLFLRRFDLLCRRASWLPIGIPLLLCVPWFILTRNVAHPLPPTPEFVMMAVRAYAGWLVGLGGSVMLALAVAGFMSRVILPWRRGQVDVLCAVQGSFVMSVLGFHCLLACGLEARYLLPAVPGLLVLAAAGLVDLGRRLAPKMATFGPVRLAVVCLFLLSIHVMAQRPHASGVRGYASLADALMAGEGRSVAAMLVSSDSDGEGAFISQIAIRENRPGHRVFRASKALTDSNWEGTSYRARFQTPAQIIDHFTATGVKLLVVDSSVPRRNRLPYHDQVERVVGGFPDRWQEVGAYPAMRDGKYVANALKVYRLLSPTTGS